MSWVHFWAQWFPKADPADPLEVETDEVEISTRRRPVMIIRAYRVVNCDQCAGPGIDKFREKHPPVEGPVNNDNDAIVACEDCRETDITLVCGVCRDRAERVAPLSSYPCRDFQDDEAGPVRDMGGRLPVTAPVGAWGRPYRAR